MAEQLLIVCLFALNLCLLWPVILTGKLSWYKYPGAVCFVVLPLLGVLFSQPRFELDYFWWRVAGCAAIVGGLAVAGWALRAKSFFGELSTNGPYHYLRHPVYLGLIFIFVGWWWVWAAVYTYYFGLIIIALIWVHGWLEEKLILKKKYGQAYLDYRRRTGMFWIK